MLDTLIDKIPELAKPYSPSTEIDWDRRSLDIRRWSRLFSDPIVAQEFKVFMHRDVTQLLMALMLSLCIIFAAGVFEQFRESPELYSDFVKAYWISFLSITSLTGVACLVLDGWTFLKLNAEGTSPNETTSTTSSERTNNTSVQEGGSDTHRSNNEKMNSAPHGEHLVEDGGNPLQSRSSSIRGGAVSTGDKRKQRSSQELKAVAEMASNGQPAKNLDGTSSSEGDTADQDGENNNGGGTKPRKQFNSVQALSTYHTREKLANRRFWLMFPVLYVSPIVGSFCQVYLFSAHCTSHDDLVENKIGIPMPEHGVGAERYCAQTLPAFWTFSIACAVPLHGSPVPTWYLSPVFLLNVVAQVFTMTAYPAKTPQDLFDSAHVTSRVLLTLVVFLVAGLIHWVNYSSSVRLFLDKIQLVKQQNLAKQREAEVELLMRQILPESVLNRVTKMEQVVDFSSEASVLFSDMKKFTAWSSKRSPTEVVSMLNVICVETDLAALRWKVEKIKTLGDGYWAVAGLPQECLDHAERLCNFGNAMIDVLASQNKRHSEWEEIELRVGIHSGVLSGAVLGARQLSYEVFGATCNFAARIEQAGVPGKVVVSESTLEALGVPRDRWGQPLTMLSQVEEQVGDGGLSPTGGGVAVAPSFFEMNGPKFIPIFTLPRGKNIIEAFYHHNHLVATGRSGGGGFRSPSVDAASMEHSFAVSETSSISTLDITVASGATGSVVSETLARQRRKFLAMRRRHEKELLSNFDLVSLGAMSSTAETEMLSQQNFADQMSAAGSITYHFSRNSSEGDDAEEILPSADDVLKTHSERRYPLLLQDFKNPAQEEAYHRYMSRQQYKVKVITRSAALCLILVILCSVILRDTLHVLGHLQIGLFGIGFSTALLDLGLLYREEALTERSSSVSTVQRAQAVLGHLSAVCTLIASGTLPKGTSLATNDITYMFFLFTMILLGGNTGLVSVASLVGANLFILTPVAIWLVWHNVAFFIHCLLITVVAVACASMYFTLEKSYRTAFAQSYVSEFLKEQQEEKVVDQEVLLRSMVPHHIVPALIDWIQHGMDVQRPIVETLPITAVCFVHIDCAALASRKIRGGSMAPSDGSSRSVFSEGGKGGGNSKVASSSSAFEDAASPPLEPVRVLTTITAVATPSSSGTDGRAEIPEGPAGSGLQRRDVGGEEVTSAVCPPAVPPTASSSSGVLSPSSGGPPSSFPSRKSSNTSLSEISNHHYHAVKLLQEAHFMVDHLLDQYKAITKIKTIGDILMLAGPFGNATQEQDTDDFFGVETGSEFRSRELENLKRMHDREDLLADSILQLVLACLALQKICPMRAGLHCGELVGAVLGRSRLCFDIFGDTVNTASRIMNSGEEGDISISSHLKELLLNFAGDSGLQEDREKDEQKRSIEDRLSDEVEVSLKGKGIMKIFRLPYSSGEAEDA